MLKHSILLIDDDSDLLQVVARRCQEIGFDVTTARNLLTANWMIDRRVPEIVCIDVNMSTGNGLRFCEMLANDPKTAHVPIIVLTGQRDAQTVQTCERLGVHYMPKRPDVWDELNPLIQELASSASRAAPQAAPDSQSRDPASKLIPPCPGDNATDDPNREVAKQVVIADDDPDVVELLTQRLNSVGCSVIATDNALDAINAIHRVLPDLVCLDVNMPSGNGLSVCEMMSNDQRLRMIPAIVLTGCADESTIRRCHDMLVFYVQKGSDVWSRVEPLVTELLFASSAQPAAAAQPSTPTQPATASEDGAEQPSDPQAALMDAVFTMLGTDSRQARAGTNPADHTVPSSSEPDPPWVLCIDDDADFSDVLRLRLEEHGVAVARAYSGMEGFRMAFTSPARAILLDYNMPNGQGDYVLDRLKSNPVTKDIPVVVITGMKDKMLERRMHSIGASGFFHKPVNFVELRDHLASHIDILATPAGQSVPATA